MTQVVILLEATIQSQFSPATVTKWKYDLSNEQVVTAGSSHPDKHAKKRMDIFAYPSVRTSSEVIRRM